MNKKQRNKQIAESMKTYRARGKAIAVVVPMEYGEILSELAATHGGMTKAVCYLVSFWKVHDATEQTKEIDKGVDFAKYLLSLTDGNCGDARKLLNAGCKRMCPGWTTKYKAADRSPEYADAQDWFQTTVKHLRG